jgi:endoglucanase
METKIPEGLQHQSASTIAAWIASAGFNCVRLTYSIDMALNPNENVSDSFIAAAEAAGVPTSDMQTLFDSAVEKNSFLSSASTRSTFAAVIDALAQEDVMVILDNHNSHASWCCGTDDGNGWWDSASGYDEANSRYFVTEDWLAGLGDMASFAADHPNVVGMSLRNELRAVGSQDQDNHADWYDLCGQGANAIHSANGDLLIAVGGVSYATDFSFLGSQPFDRSAYPDKILWEFHSYSWSTVTSDCFIYQSILGNNAGYLLTQDEEYTGPLWLSEFGYAVESPSAAEIEYINCLVSYMENNDAEWAYWALQGSYYVRDATINLDETFGVLNSDWSDWRNSSFASQLGQMWEVTQGP